MLFGCLTCPSSASSFSVICIVVVVVHGTQLPPKMIASHKSSAPWCHIASSSRPAGGSGRATISLPSATMRNQAVPPRILITCSPCLLLMCVSVAIHAHAHAGLRCTTYGAFFFSGIMQSMVTAPSSPHVGFVITRVPSPVRTAHCMRPLGDPQQQMRRNVGCGATRAVCTTDRG